MHVAVPGFLLGYIPIMKNSSTRLLDTSSYSSTSRSSTTTPRTSRESPSSPSRRTTPKISPTSLLQSQKGQQKDKQPIFHTTPSSLLAPQTPQATQDLESMSTEMLRAAYKKLQQKVADMQHKLLLQEEKGRSDQKKIQALELVLQCEAASSPSSISSPAATIPGGRMAETKYLAQIDALSTKLYKLEERNQAMVEELTSLKSDLRNKKKEHESKIKELQLKHDFDMRSLEQQQREFASGLQKETRKDIDGLKQHLGVQESDLQKKHMREMQDLKTEQQEQELQFKEVIQRLQDELEYLKQTVKHMSIRKSDMNMIIEMDEESALDIVEQADQEDQEEGDPEECY